MSDDAVQRYKQSVQPRPNDSDLLVPFEQRNITGDYREYYTIKRVVNRIVADNPSTVPAVRAEFDRAKQVEYSIESVSSSDLVVTKDNDKLQISFAYDKQIPLAGPVYLLIKYEGRSN